MDQCIQIIRICRSTERSNRRRGLLLFLLHLHNYLLKFLLSFFNYLYVTFLLHTLLFANTNVLFSHTQLLWQVHKYFQTTQYGELRRNILTKFGYQTATYWLLKEKNKSLLVSLSLTTSF